MKSYLGALIVGTLLTYQSSCYAFPYVVGTSRPKHQPTTTQRLHSSTKDEISTSSPTTKRKINETSRRADSVPSFKVMDVLQRANELQSLGESILHCEVGQPETGAPSSVASAAVAALTASNPREVLGYTDAFGLLPLRERIASHYSKKYDGSTTTGNDDALVVDPKNIVVTTGSSGGFLLTFAACFDVGDVVAVASSGYPCYRNILTALGCELATVSVNDEFKLTAVELSEEIRRRKASGDEEKPIAGLILSSPSNPTGAMLSPAELKSLCELCDDEGVQFVSDEIYHGISYGKEEATALMYSKNAIVINSFSKYYSMSGWRLGWMVVPTALIPAVNSLQQNMFISAPTISQTAAMKCWDEDTIEELEKHVEKYKTSREIILFELDTIPGAQFRIAPADGGFYVYVDLSRHTAPGLGSVELCRALLEEEGVALTPGVDFEDPATGLGDRRLRISYAGGVATAREAMKRFKRFWPVWEERVKAAAREEGSVTER